MCELYLEESADDAVLGGEEGGDVERVVECLGVVAVAQRQVVDVVEGCR